MSTLALDEREKMKVSALHLLILEDQRVDAERIAAELEAGGLKFTWRRVDNEADFKQAAASADLILADYHLPEYSAREALIWFRRHHPDVPFILVSGKTDESTALETIALGATDYIFKDRLGRIRFAVERALAESNFRETHQKMRSAFQEETEKYREFVEGTADLVVQTDPEGRYTFVNRRAEKYLGLPPEQCLGVSAFEFVHPDDLETTRAAFFRWVNSKESFVRFNNRVLSKTGHTYDLSWTINLHYDADGKLLYLNAIAQDRTEQQRLQQQLQETLRKHESILEASPAAIYALDTDGTVLSWNRAAEQIFGWTAEEVIGRPNPVVPEESWQDFLDNLRQTLAGEGVFQKDLVRRTKDGRSIDINLSAAPLRDDQNRVVGVMAIIFDISDRMQLEAYGQRQTLGLAKRIRELNSFYRLTELLNASGRSVEDKMQEAVELLPPTLYHPEAARSRIRIGDQEYLSEDFLETPWCLTAPIRSGTSELGVVEIFYREEMPPREEGPFLHEERSMLETFAERLGSFLQLHQTMEELNEFNLRQQHLLATNPAIVFSASAQPPYETTFVSDNVRSILGYEAEAFLGSTTFWQENVHPDDLTRVEETLKGLGVGDKNTFEYRFRHADGSWRWMMENVILIGDEAGEPLEYVGSWSETTTFREAEEMLHRMTAIIEATTDFVGISDEKGRTKYINPAGRRLLGFDEKTDLVDEKIERFHPDWAAEILLRDAIPTAKEKGSWTGETALCRVDGAEIPASQVVLAHYAANGKVRYLSTIIRDISEQKRSEAELIRLNRTLRTISLCNEALVKASSEKELIDTIVHVLVESGYPMAMVMPGGEEAEPVIHPEVGRNVFFSMRETGCGLIDHLNDIARVPFSREIILDPDIINCTKCTSCHDLVDILRLNSAYSLVLTSEQAQIGSLVIFSGEEGFFTQEVMLLKELADDLSYGISALRTKRDHQQALRGLHLRNRAMEASSNGIMISEADPELPIIYVNAAFERITGYSAEEVRRRNPRFLSGSDQKQPGLVDIRNALQAGRPAKALLRNYRKDGQLFWNELSVSPVRDDEGTITHFISIINDVTDRRNYEEELERRSNYDDLTGLANRNLFSDRLSQGIAHARRTEQLLAVVLIDLDRFQIINDSLGHSIGNVLLKGVADRLSSCIRTQDTLSRLGGDEFVILLQDVQGRNDVEIVFEKIRNALTHPFEIGNRSLRITASVGVSFFPKDGDDEEGLLRNADLAMYHAKSLGRDTLQFFAAEMDAQIVETMDLEADLRQAIERDELILYFQPKVDVGSGKIVGSEALIRWQHPSRGMVSPGAFIPLAEETGLIEPIGQWVLREACRFNKSLQAKGFPAITVSANISARQFRNERLVEVVEAALHETGMDPRWLDLELTESMLMDQPEKAAEAMKRLKALGVSLSLDDFGTGYSSLNYLRRFPIDTLKIDRTFIADVESDAGSASVANSIIDIAHNLKINAVAEGVETVGQLEFLRKSRCDTYQGFFFSRPVPAEEFAELLKKSDGE